MEWNRVGDRGGTALGELLQSNKTLIRLDVCNCRMGDECCGELSEGLKTTKSLEVFKADGNAFGHGTRLIIDVLARSSFKYSVEGCKYDGDHLKHDYEEGNATGSYRIDLANSHQVTIFDIQYPKPKTQNPKPKTRNMKAEIWRPKPFYLTGGGAREATGDGQSSRE
jgi:hypothetical protein